MYKHEKNLKNIMLRENQFVNDIEYGTYYMKFENMGYYNYTYIYTYIYIIQYEHTVGR